MDNTQIQSNAPKTIKMKKKLPKWLKITIIIIIIAAMVAGGYFTYTHFFTKKKETKLNTAKVSYGDVSVTISGSGAIKPIDEYEVLALVQGDILECTFEEGDQVNKGDILYKIDTADIDNSIQKAENSLEKAKITYDDALKNQSELSVKSPTSGVVTAVYAENGDNISNNGKIMDIVDSTVMYLDVPFITSDARSIYAGESANVTLEGSYYTISGVVSRVASGSSVSSENVEVSTVSIKINNPGAIKENDSATAVIGGVACNSAGKFTYGDSRTILSKQSGEVSYQPYKVGDKVEKGATVMQINSDSIGTTIRNAQLSLNESELSLANQKEQLKNYNLTAPISGKVIKKTSKSGDTLKSSDSKTVMAIIADMSKMVFDINVDELDISKISSGQKVSISSDALEEKNFTGTVEYVSVVGTTTNGVTSYPVTVSVDNPDKLIPGMNVDAKIVVESRSNVLRVPVSSVKRGNIVTVKIDESKQQGIDPSTLAKNNFITNNKPSASADANGQQNAGGGQPNASAAAQGKTQGNRSGSSQGNTSGDQQGNKQSDQGGSQTRKFNIDQTNVPEGYKNVMVTIGLNDDSYIEITGGLNEGDIVIVPTTASTTRTTMPGGMGGMGGMGGFPGGGGTYTRSSSSSSSSSGRSGS